jgi:UDP-glucose 4-epimerase
MRVLITGGSGFIGSHVVDKLFDAGHHVRLFDLSPSPYHSPEEVDFRAGSITDVDALVAAMAGCDAVIHLAAVADVNDVVADPSKAQEVNSKGTLAVLEAARRAGVGRIVYGSTIWAYSDCPERSVDEETRVAAPSHLYTATKLAGEHYCKSYAELYGLSYTVLRFGIPYGPRARDATVLAAFCAKAEAGEPLTVSGDGSQSRRFVYVEDLADGVVAALRPAAANRVYNLAGSEAVTVLDIAEAVRDHVADTGIVHTEGRMGDFGGKEVSSERAERELGWAPRTRFAEGFRRYLGWRRARPERRRVLILTADIGEGHDLPARALARDLAIEHPGSEVEIVDGLRAMGRLMTAVVRDGSWFAFNWFPPLFAFQYWLLQTFPPTRWLGLHLSCLLGARRLRRIIRRYDPDVVVSTYPGTTAVLGELRLRRLLDVPVVSAITDLAGLQFWAHPGVDLHTITHRESIEEVEAIAGPGSARWARPPTDPAFLAPRSHEEARRALDLPLDDPVVAVSGGGWGIGDLVGAVEEALAIPGSTVLCLSGHNERATARLQARFGPEPRVRLLGFTDRMSDLLAAADALVHSTAGLTVLEAQIRGCPVVSYGFAVGHVRASNRAYERFGLARVATSRGELASALREAVAAEVEPDPAFASLPSPATLAIEAHPRVKPRRVARLRAVRLARVATATAALAVGAFLTDYAYALLAKPLGVATTKEVSTARPEVGILVDAPPGSVTAIARELRRDGVRATFAVAETPSTRALAVLHSNGDEAIPMLTGGGFFHSLGTKGRLSRAADALGLGDHFAYQPQNDGMTLSQALLARSAGGSPVAGAVHCAAAGAQPALTRGDLVEVDIGGGTQPTETVGQLASDLASSGLQGVTVSSLMGSGT